MIHTVGPRYRQDPAPAEALGNAFRNSLSLAVEHQLQTVAFPAISCGVYGYPLLKCATVATSVSNEGWPLSEVRFVLFDRRAFAVFEHVFG